MTLSRSTPKVLAATVRAATAGLASLVLLAGCTGGSGTTASSGAATPSATPPAATDAAYRDASRPVAERVSDLLGRMELADKVGQMTQAERGSVSTSDMTRLRIGSVLSGGGSVPEPNTAQGWQAMYDELQTAALATPLGIPMIYGIDAVHGNNNLAGATVFPHNIGLGATRDPALVEQIGAATAAEVAATGVDWTFSPCLCVVRDERWGRSYESFGETPEIVTAMTSIVTGYQGATLGGSPTSILATAKHFVADGGTLGGKDQGDAQLSNAELRAIHLPGYLEAIKRGVGSVMVSFSSVNGEKMHADTHLLTEVLKGELGFSGFVVSDWNGIDQLDGTPGFTTTEVTTAINAGIDMVMVPERHEEFVAALTSAVESGAVPVARIDDAVRRILTKKFQLGLFERPLADPSLTAQVGSAEHRALARTAVAESLVVLTDDGTLPVAKTARILVAGTNADDVGNQSGGWTLTWQGQSGPVPGGTSILAGIEAAAVGGEVVHDDAAADPSGFDLAIAVVGETPYAEYEGDRPDGLVLDAKDTALLDRLHSAGVPTVVVVVSGRPLDLGGAQDWASAVVAAWLPGTEGAGVADVLFGAVEPHGTLPVSWPASATQEPVNDGDGQTPLFPLGAGITSWK